MNTPADEPDQPGLDPKRAEDFVSVVQSAVGIALACALVFGGLIRAPNARQVEVLRRALPLRYSWKALGKALGALGDFFELVFESRWGWSMVILFAACVLLGGVLFAIAASQHDWEDIFANVNHDAAKLFGALVSAL